MSIFDNNENKAQFEKNTEVLFKEIKNSNNIYKYIHENKENFYHPSFSEYLLFLLKENHMKKSHLISQSGISRQYAYEIFAGTKKPSRLKILCLSMAMRASLDQTQKLLTYGGHHPLYPKDLYDSVLIHGIQKKMSLIELNNILYDLSLEILE